MAFSSDDVPLDGARALLVGAGGAARPIVFALARAGLANLVIANRTMEAAQLLAESVNILISNCKRQLGPPRLPGTTLW